MNYWYSILGSEIEFHEAMVEAKKTELLNALKRRYKVAMKLEVARVVSYRQIKEDTATKDSIPEAIGVNIAIIDGTRANATGVTDTDKKEVGKKHAGKKILCEGGSNNTRNLLHAVKLAKIAVVQGPITPQTTRITKASSVKKSKPIPTTMTRDIALTVKVDSDNTSLDPSAPKKKIYEPMPFIESAFHKAPPPKLPESLAQT
ncbi:hypothetical protein ONS95_012334 [Cadophora gregata]|uniref:uncharacterized protein n=1 Tax=Cadophora gregata TaxID=51156 RepID=UPI0026DB1C91|nr:uncharacterized protein ONS95_012334 [Cadophora gregata]KAK0118023.1 hypothetical protein ONS95_012334 [Cadophora gregata]KAK0123089.1 hypothetical protein ONS96_010097 [Cadophora gregata f. sp. sojae]